MGNTIILDGIPYGTSAPPSNTDMGHQITSTKTIERNIFLHKLKKLMDNLTIDNKNS